MIGRIATFFLMGASAALAEPAPEQFAYEAPLALVGTASVYRAPLTEAVYAGVTRPDLGDLRVFNAAGEPVPHALVLPAPAPEALTARLPFFPLAESEASGSGDVSVRVEVRKDGSIVKVDGKAPAQTGKRGYLLDLTPFEQPMRALTFAWDPETGWTGLRRLRIEASEDLKRWRLLTQGTVARLQHEGKTFERNRVELSAQRVRYLRVVADDNGPDLALSGVDAEFAPAVEPVRSWSAPRPQPSGKADEHTYVLDGRMAVDRARLDVAPNSVMRVTILYRAKDGDTWKHAGRKTIYRLETSGAVVKDDEIPFGRSIAASQWLVRLSGQGTNDAPAPVLSLGWVAHDLVFVAQGEPPFRLAYGKHGLAPVDYGVAELLRRTKGDEQRVEIGEATLGGPVERQGERARRPGWTAGWRTWLLWAVLILGVGALALFAVRVGRQLRAEEPRR